MSAGTDSYLVVVQPLDRRYRVKQALIRITVTAAVASGWVVAIWQR